MVRVEPAREGWFEALADGDDVFEARFGIRAEPGWAGFEGVIEWTLSCLQRGLPAEWGTHLIFDEDGTLIGNGGWKGAPVDGVAELGYAVAPARQGQGVATAVVHQLVARGWEAGLRMILAHTLPDLSASTTVLTRCGFTHVGDADEDGVPVWRWELTQP